VAAYGENDMAAVTGSHSQSLLLDSQVHRQPYWLSRKVRLFSREAARTVGRSLLPRHSIKGASHLFRR